MTEVGTVVTEKISSENENIDLTSNKVQLRQSISDSPGFSKRKDNIHQGYKGRNGNFRKGSNFKPLPMNVERSSSYEDVSQMHGIGYSPQMSPASSSNSLAFSRNSSYNELSAMSGNSSASSPSRKPCMFFMQGNCRNGDQCRWSHELPNSSGNSPRGTPNMHGVQVPSPMNIAMGNMPMNGMAFMPNPNGNHMNNSAIIQMSPMNGSVMAPQQHSVPASPQPIVSTISLQSSPGSPPQSITIINVPPGQPIFSIDVECVATATLHNARSVAQVALVDEWSRPIFNVLIKQDLPVVSYLTPLTGLNKEMIDNYGVPIAEAMALLRAHLPPNAILVGQNIQKDVQWLQLAEGVDYASLIDLASLFRAWDPAKQDFITFSQDHSASVWMGMPQRAHHDALTDAAISMSLFNTYRSIQWDHSRLQQMQMAALSAPRIPGFSSLYPVIDGCCMGNRKKCICGAPFQ